MARLTSVLHLLLFLLPLVSATTYPCYTRCFPSRHSRRYCNPLLCYLSPCSRKSKSSILRCLPRPSQSVCSNRCFPASAALKRCPFSVCKLTPCVTMKRAKGMKCVPKKPSSACPNVCTSKRRAAAACRRASKRCMVRECRGSHSRYWFRGRLRYAKAWICAPRVKPTPPAKSPPRPPPSTVCPMKCRIVLRTTAKDCAPFKGVCIIEKCSFSLKGQTMNGWRCAPRKGRK